jgi:hypothetical protein
MLNKIKTNGCFNQRLDHPILQSNGCYLSDLDLKVMND